MLACFDVFGACVNQAFIDFEGGANGDALTLAKLTNSFHGADGVWVIQNGGMNFTNTGQHTLNGNVNVCSGIGPAGGTFTGSGNVGLSILANGLDTQVLFFYPTNGGGQAGPNTSCQIASIGVWMMTDMLPLNPVGGGGNGQQHDLLFLKGEQVGFAGAGDFVNPYINNRNDRSPCTGQSWWGLESGLFSPTTPICCETNANWYWVTAQMHHAESNRVNIYNEQLQLLGHIEGQAGATSYPNSVQMRYQTGDSGTHIYFDSLIVDFDQGTFPLLPNTNTTFYTNVVINGVLRNFSSQ